MMLLEHRNLGRLSMGCVKGSGPIEIGQHIHNELAQWYFPLPGSEFIYTAGGEEVHMTGGDLSFTPTGFWHGSKCGGRQEVRLHLVRDVHRRAIPERSSKDAFRTTAFRSADTNNSIL